MSYQEAMNKFGLLPLTTRREELMKKMFTEIKNPAHKLHKHLPDDSHKYSLRRKKAHILPQIRTKRCQDSFINWCLFNCDP